MFQKSRRELSIADHMSAVALPMVKDKKVFLTVLKHIKKSMYLMSRAYLLKQKKIRVIGVVPENEELCFQMFLEKFSSKFSIGSNEKHYLKELEKVVDAYENSQAEIKRGDNYVIFLPNFQTVTVNSSNVKKYLSVASKIFTRVEDDI